jgi:predicted RNase H-like nuclease (RuvC/YqgF family)
MKHIIFSLFTALLLTTPALSQKRQGPVSKAPPAYEMIKEWRKAFSDLKNKVERMQREITMLKKQLEQKRKPNTNSRRGNRRIRVTPQPQRKKLPAAKRRRR